MDLKQMVGEKAATFVENDMTVGLGTGSTAYYMVEALGKRVAEGLNIVGVTTSKATYAQAEKLGIPLKSIDEVDHVDITIDGADEISADYQGIKGGGAALLMEKIVATYSKQVIWIVDESKMVEHLGAFPLPVEVIPYGDEQLFRLFDKAGFEPSFRLTENDEKLVTDMGHHIIDLHLTLIERHHELAKWLDSLVGVVEHGLFLDMANKVIVGSPDGVKVIDAR